MKRDFFTKKSFNELVSSKQADRSGYINLTSKEIAECKIAITNYYNKKFYIYIGLLNKNTNLNNESHSRYYIKKCKINEDILILCRKYAKEKDALLLREGKKIFDTLNNSENQNKLTYNLPMSSKSEIKFQFYSVHYNGNKFIYTLKYQNFSIEINQDEFIKMLVKSKFGMDICNVGRLCTFVYIYNQDTKDFTVKEGSE